LIDNKKEFLSIKKLEDFPFDSHLLSCKNRGQFPDLAIRLMKDLLISMFSEQDNFSKVRTVDKANDNRIWKKGIKV